jgi:hypothetical protein
MRPIYELSGESPPVLMRDPLAENLIGDFSHRGRALASPRPARTDGGKSLVPFWRRWWRSF